MSRETLYVEVAMFSGIDGAERAFADAHDRDPAADWMADAAFVGVPRDGRIVVRGLEPLPAARGPAFDAIRERVPEGSSAVVVISIAERVHTMSEALAGAAETFDGYRLGPHDVAGR